MISSDMLGPIKTSQFITNRKELKIYILTITDVFTRYTENALSWDIRAKTIAQQIKKYRIKKHGPSKNFLSDQGRK